MCNLSKGVMEKGYSKGLAEGMAKGMAKGIAKGIAKGHNEGHTERALSDLRSLMETLGLSMEQAMDALKIPETERQEYAGLLGNLPC